MILPGILASGITGNLVTNSFESIATLTANGSQSTLTFTSIPSTFKHLQVRLNARGNDSGATGQDLTLQFNSISSGYARHQLYGDGTSANSGGTTGDSQVNLGYLPAASSPANVYGVAIIDILDYASATKAKTIRSLSGNDQNNADGIIFFNSGFTTANTNAITTVSLKSGTYSGGNFTSGSTFALYGIKG